MGKPFYDLDEAKAKLGLSEDELKALVRDGQLREFRDAGQIRYKSADVDGLAENLGSLGGSLGGDTGELILDGGESGELSLDTGTGELTLEEPAGASASGTADVSLGGETGDLSLGGESGELVLEPSEESSMGLTGSDMLTLDEADREDTDDTSVIDDTQEDTVITSVGISVFDDEEVTEADPGAQTVLEGDRPTADTGSGMSLEMSSTGTGSGLLDLTREADDTSLGAELLDEIYSEDQEPEAGGSGSDPEMGEDTRASILDSSGTEPGEEEADLRETEELPTPAPQQVAPIVVHADGGGAVEIGLTAAMFGAILVLGVAGIAVSANIQSVLPSVLGTIFEKMPLFAGVFAGVPLLLFVIGLLIGRRR